MEITLQYLGQSVLETFQKGDNHVKQKPMDE